MFIKRTPLTNTSFQKKKIEEATNKGMISKWTSWDRQKANKKKKIAFQKVRQRIFWTCNQTYKKQEYKRPQNERQPMFQSKKIKASKQGGNC